MSNASDIVPISWYAECEVEDGCPPFIRCFYRKGSTTWAVKWEKWGVTKYIAISDQWSPSTWYGYRYIILWDGTKEVKTFVEYEKIEKGPDTFDKMLQELIQYHSGLKDNPNYRKKKNSKDILTKYPFFSEKWFMRHFNSAEMKKLTEDFMLTRVSQSLPI